MIVFDISKINPDLNQFLSLNLPKSMLINLFFFLSFDMINELDIHVFIHTFLYLLTVHILEVETLW